MIVVMVRISRFSSFRTARENSPANATQYGPATGFVKSKKHHLFNKRSAQLVANGTSTVPGKVDRRVPRVDVHRASTRAV